MIRNGAKNRQIRGRVSPGGRHGTWELGRGNLFVVGDGALSCDGDKPEREVRARIMARNREGAREKERTGKRREAGNGFFGCLRTSMHSIARKCYALVWLVQIRH